MTKVTCESCGKKYKDIKIMKHIIGECKIPKNKKKREMYWENLIKKDLQDYAEKLKDNKIVPKYPEASLTEIRCFFILYAFGWIKLPKDELPMSPNEVINLIASVAPEVLYYILEYFSLIEEDKKTGNISITELGEELLGYDKRT